MFIQTVKIEKLGRNLSSFLTFYCEGILSLFIKSHFFHKIDFFGHSPYYVLFEVYRIVWL